MLKLKGCPAPLGSIVVFLFSSKNLVKKEGSVQDALLWNAMYDHLLCIEVAGSLTHWLCP